MCLLQTDIQQREALVHFHAPDHSQTSMQQKALLREGPLEPALQSRRQQLITRTAELKMKARELDAALEVSSCIAGFSFAQEGTSACLDACDIKPLPCKTEDRRRKTLLLLLLGLQQGLPS